jgi:EAL domain-containing protein (putative c-di-GMP-specific phosphodiesterase class I)
VLLKDNSIIGVEAFIRWNHPEYGILYPADFISQAEICDLVPEIDRWVSRKACQQLKEWKELGLPLVPISINISPDTIVNNQFIEDISSIVLENACDPEFLQIEINRSNLVFQDEDIKQHLSQLNDLGIRLAIDNFATDAANQINQVSQMPIQSVKIDRTIVQGIQEDDDKQRLINAVVKMAKSLQVEVVAQGVESKEQVAILKKQDIEVAQGFFLGDPVKAYEMAELLEKPKTPKRKTKKE